MSLPYIIKLACRYKETNINQNHLKEDQNRQLIISSRIKNYNK